MKKPSRRTLLYFAVSMALMLASNRVFYDGARFLNQNRAMHFMKDADVPYLSWTVAIYFGCFAVWAAIYFLVSCRGREEADRFFLSILLGKILCFIVYLIYPTTKEALVFDPADQTIWTNIMRLLYKVDSPENLFPSLHCLLAWACWIGVRFKRDIPLWQRISAFVWAVAVCVSTLTTKQHVPIDIPGGILAAELCWFIAGRKRVLAPYSAAVTRIVEKLDGLFSKKSGEERTPGAK